MNKEYKISTVLDFESVPDDRLQDCLQEFMDCVIMARTMPIPLSLEGFTWIDDGISMIRSVDLRIGDKVENIPNPNFPVKL